mmetsp:Transcript_6164/g.15717  ORF Transcript_6164/g.15717 Transcript_6164/m.15717 type:complete len:149 (+) Transcript_6164:584-1030(+)
MKRATQQKGLQYCRLIACDCPPAPGALLPLSNCNSELSIEPTAMTPSDSEPPNVLTPPTSTTSELHVETIVPTLCDSDDDDNNNNDDDTPAPRTRHGVHSPLLTDTPAPASLTTHPARKERRYTPTTRCSPPSKSFQRTMCRKTCDSR